MNRRTRGKTPAYGDKGTSAGRSERMVEGELEAAEVLAGLARSVTRRDDVDGSTHISIIGDSKRRSSAIKNESLADIDSAPRVCRSEDLFSHCQQQSGQIPNLIGKPVKVENETEFGPLGMSSTNSTSSPAGKSKLNLSEAEKEARRVRRILANRESARQTIRRRQALYEELTRKAADLALENQNLKREKELAIKEYDSLRSRNSCLKEEVAKISKIEKDDVHGKSELVEENVCASASPTPILVYNQTSIIPLWPSCFQSLSAFQPQTGVPVPFQILAPPSENYDTAHQHANPMVNRSGPPMYVVPFSWLFPFHTHDSIAQAPSSGINHRVRETCPSHCHSAISSSTAMHAENDNAPLSINAGSQVSSKVIMPCPGALHDAGSSFPPDGGGRLVEPHCNEVLVPQPVNLVEPGPSSNVTPDKSPQIGGTCDGKTVNSSEGLLENGRRKIQEQVTQSRKKSAETGAAADARKRRKELMKLKSLHCHQHHMPF